MRVEILHILAAKFLPPIVLVIFVISQYIYIPEVNSFIGLLLFLAWWASYEICTEYEKYEAKKRNGESDAG